jgi:hypothetical protein
VTPLPTSSSVCSSATSPSFPSPPAPQAKSPAKANKGSDKSLGEQGERQAERQPPETGSKAPLPRGVAARAGAGRPADAAPDSKSGLVWLP